MDIFDRNLERANSLATAIKAMEYALEKSEIFQRLELLKEQQRMLPNNQGFTMGKYNVVGQKPQWTDEELAESKRKTDLQNEKDWQKYEIEYAAFCKLHGLETWN